MSETEPARTAATLHDVAREAGVSLATASRSLNGSTRKVNDEYRQRVLAAAARLNYTTNLSAQAVARGATTTVALLVADIADPYFSSIASGVIAAADEANLIVTMAATDRDPDRELDLVRQLRGQRPRVMILSASRPADDPTADALVAELAAYERSGGHVVIISRNELGFRTVPLDNRGGAEALARTLVGLGYRRFAAVTGDEGLRGADDRLEGFRAGLAGAGGGAAGVPAGADASVDAGASAGADASRASADAGADASGADAGAALPDSRIARAAFTRDGGYAAMQELLGRGLGGAELVFAANDVMAVGALAAIRDAGLAPGRDLAVAGFDDIPTVRDVTPPLTTVRVPLEELGRRALRLALGEDSAGGVTGGADSAGGTAGAADSARPEREADPGPALEVIVRDSTPPLASPRP
ncbi:LacI family DNA-binding transcriptional regulator [Agromyces archimandritae]|uniref:LacI family DNA-binding transcriptional regulator n=1 Tax=Agromyces archimandritae TaxID=2781962 RepID=A0A975FLA2_9MICO|nr:LacI family DNA-binding transcriptional regulator [Agromyces archimandritae]QTX03523.1 LacI family DNA-binding transcriptional regulator [Agromyces archimandritae]